MIIYCAHFRLPVLWAVSSFTYVYACICYLIIANRFRVCYTKHVRLERVSGLKRGFQTIAICCANPQSRLTFARILMSVHKDRTLEIGNGGFSLQVAGHIASVHAHITRTRASVRPRYRFASDFLGIKKLRMHICRSTCDAQGRMLRAAAERRLFWALRKCVLAMSAGPGPAEIAWMFRIEVSGKSECQ